METLPIQDTHTGQTIEIASSKSKPEKNKGAKTVEKQDKSQEKIRESYEKRFNVFLSSIEKQVSEYEKMLEDGSFDDKDGEAVGSGDRRKEQIQKSIVSGTDRVESMKNILDSGKDIPSIADQIEVEYSYTNPQTNKVERHESITIDIEKEIQEFTEFYKQANIDVPRDFEESVREIWSRNYDEIQKSVEEQGFDDILIIPANLSIVDISKKLKMDNGYYDYIKSSSRVDDLDGIPLISTGIDSTRIVLVHRAQNLKDYPELVVTKGKKAQDLVQENSLSLEDYIIFQNKYNKETNKHLDEDGWTWLLRTKSGARFVGSYWNPGVSGLRVDANDADYSDPRLGCRASRYFT